MVNTIKTFMVYLDDKKVNRQQFKQEQQRVAAVIAKKNRSLKIVQRES